MATYRVAPGTQVHHDGTTYAAGRRDSRRAGVGRADMVVVGLGDGRRAGEEDRPREVNRSSSTLFADNVVARADPRSPTSLGGRGSGCTRPYRVLGIGPSRTGTESGKDTGRPDDRVSLGRSD
jgi:hypothetical protein